VNREDIIRWAKEAHAHHLNWDVDYIEGTERFAALVAAAERDACLKIIGSYRVPVGNSAAGELACEWTMNALQEIYEDIRARGEG
jgi:hypothetical protein